MNMHNPERPLPEVIFIGGEYMRRLNDDPELVATVGRVALALFSQVAPDIVLGPSEEMNQVEIRARADEQEGLALQATFNHVPHPPAEPITVAAAEYIPAMAEVTHPDGRREIRHSWYYTEAGWHIPLWRDSEGLENAGEHLTRVVRDAEADIIMGD